MLIYNDIIVKLTYYNKLGVRHREGYPAKIEYLHDCLITSWYSNDKYHREDGYALTVENPTSSHALPFIRTLMLSDKTTTELKCNDKENNNSIYYKNCYLQGTRVTGMHMQNIIAKESTNKLRDMFSDIYQNFEKHVLQIVLDYTRDNEESYKAFIQSKKIMCGDSNDKGRDSNDDDDNYSLDNYSDDDRYSITDDNRHSIINDSSDSEY